MRTWILPMAGRGTRSQALGECKPAIRVLDRPILAWCLTGLSPVMSDDDTVIVTTTQYFEDEYGISTLIQKALSHLRLSPGLEIVVLDEVPPGPAASVYAAVDLFRRAGETVVVNSDQFIQFRAPSHTERWDAFVPLYVNSTGKSSYAEIRDGQIVRIVEKQLISNYASAGVYGFADGATLARALETTFEGPPHHKNEYYVGPAINALIEMGAEILPATVVAKFDLGSVPQIREFQRTAALIRADHTP